MKFSLNQIANILKAEIIGDPNKDIHTFASIEEGFPGAITFLGNEKYTSFIYQTKASAVIVPRDFQPKEALDTTLLKVEDPYTAVAILLEQVNKLKISQKKGIEKQAHIDPSVTMGNEVFVGSFAYLDKNVTIGNGVKIYPNVYIGEGSVIGDHTIIYPNVTIYHGVEVGKKCIIHAGTCLGSDGFGFAPQEDGSFKKIPQTGKVILEDEVEIGANTCIDRATFGQTIIRKGAKLDNLVQLAHNVEVGENTVIAAQAGIAGSTQLGRNCMLGGQVGIVGHLEIADKTLIDAQSGVNKSIKKEGQAFRGSPIQPHRQQLKSEMIFRKLADMYNKIRDLEAQIQTLDS
jgi:UDP-3-O-[3-hydroxymyristoyl] glucosamine N-acyltransferase